MVLTLVCSGGGVLLRGTAAGQGPGERPPTQKPGQHGEGGCRRGPGRSQSTVPSGDTWAQLSWVPCNLQLWLLGRAWTAFYTHFPGFLMNFKVWGKTSGLINECIQEVRKRKKLNLRHLASVSIQNKIENFLLVSISLFFSFKICFLCYFNQGIRLISQEYFFMGKSSAVDQTELDTLPWTREAVKFGYELVNITMAKSAS